MWEFIYTRACQGDQLFLPFRSVLMLSSHETIPSFLKAASIMRVKGEKKKRTCHPTPGNSAGDTPSTRSSVHLSNPRTRSQSHVNSFNPFLWMCFSYAWLFKRVYPFLFFLHPLDLVCRSPVCLDVPPFSHCSFSPFLCHHQRPGKYVEKEGSWTFLLLIFVIVGGFRDLFGARGFSGI